MRRAWMIVALVGMMGSWAGADTFLLTDEGGKTNGPFATVDGEVLKLPGQTYKLSLVAAPETRAAGLLRETILKQVELRDAALADAVAELSRAIAQSDGPGKKIKLIYMPLSKDDEEVDSESTSTKDAKGRETDQETGEDDDTPVTITVSASDIPANEIIAIVAEMCGARVRWLEGTVVIGGDYVSEPLFHRSYPILPNTSARIGERAECEIQRDSPVGERYEPPRPDWKAYFTKLGDVQWPKGSSIEYMSAIGRMVVVNTERNLERFEVCLRQLRVEPFQIQIEVTFLKLEKTIADAMIMEGTLTVEGVREAWRDGNAQVIAAPRVITQSGQQAEVKIVEEYIYPTEFSTAGISQPRVGESGNEPMNEAQSTSNTVVGAVVTPCNFQTREVGIILNVLPQLSPEGQMINLKMRPEFISPPEWHRFDTSVVLRDGTTHTIRTEQPFFHVYSMDTSLLLTPGATLLAANAIQHPDTTSHIVLLVRGTLVGIDGEELSW